MNERMNEKYIKVNLPSDQAGYASGNGEGVWVIVDQETYHLYHNDHSGGTFSGTLANDSLYYPELKYGDAILFTMRGESRAVCIYTGFLDNLRCIMAEEKEELIRKIMEHHRMGKE